VFGNVQGSTLYETNSYDNGNHGLWDGRKRKLRSDLKQGKAKEERSDAAYC
jgi:hypothetical protein